LSILLRTRREEEGEELLVDRLLVLHSDQLRVRVHRRIAIYDWISVNLIQLIRLLTGEWFWRNSKDQINYEGGFGEDDSILWR
jgi:hypothetical protein